MQLIERPKRSLFAQPTAFLKEIYSHRWDDYTPQQLHAALRECAQGAFPLAKAYGILKAIIHQITGLTLFDTQLLAAYSMQQGRIAELPTGEGKTLAAVVTATCFALQGKPVHILVFNDYLARRDWVANLPIYEACGLTCGYIVDASDFAHRKEAYACDVVYISAKEAGFDCLRDFLCTEREAVLLPAYPVALVDEADSILIDEARIPLVLAGNAELAPTTCVQVARAVSAMPLHYVGLNKGANQAWLTDAGVSFMESRLQLENLFMPENADTLAMINAAIEARFLLEKDKDYIVQDGAVLVVDESTGRVAENRRFPDLLQQAVEMQALGLQGIRSVVYNSISMQAFLRQYETLCGMTGTAASSAYEFRQMYELEIDVIAPHTPCIRTDHTDVIFMEKREQQEAILTSIRAAHAKGQPVLIGTRSVQESEHYSGLLTALGIAHSVLNAKNAAEEADIIADAGKPFQVTISTNMAGRGVDIRLGGRDARDADFVRAAGGLYVISTGINRSLRIDNQLRGRSGRQGDPGESRFFVCMSDLELETFFEMDFYSYKRYPKLLRRAQKIQEGKDVEARYMLERYSNILEGQRKRVTAYRTQLLLDKSMPVITQKQEPALYQQLVDRAGKRGVTLAEKQLTLYFINMNWADYLEAMESMRSGIHLMVIGKKSPLDEYMLFAASAFDEMLADIQRDVLRHMKTCVITENGIDMEAEGLLGATTTWTYMINESTTQFSRLPQIAKAVTTGVSETITTAHGFFARLRDRWQIFLLTRKK